MEIKDLQIIVHAGGGGTRIKPFISQPKPMLPIHGKPLIYWSVLPILNAGAKKFIFTVKEGKEEIKNYFEKSNLGIEVFYAEEPEPPLGRAGITKKGIELGIIDESKLTLMQNADDLISLNLMKLIQHHLEVEKFGVEVTCVAAREYKCDFGVVRFEEELPNKANYFEEKPILTLPGGVAVNTGMFLWSNLSHFKDVEIPSHPEVSILPKLSEKNKVSVFKTKTWIPVNYKHEYENLNNKMSEKELLEILK